MQERHCNKNCCTQQPSQNSTQQNCPHHSGKAYAFYYQLETLTAAANDSIDFPLTAAESSGDFLSDGNQIQILNPGVYHVRYMVHIPAETILTTTFALQVNRQNVAGTERSVAQTSTAASTSAIAETILTVCAPVNIRVTSTEAVSITGAEDEVLASLFIEQLA